MSGRVLIYVQYLLGIGHLQRSWQIAQALAQTGVAVTVVCGGEPVPALTRPQCNLAIVQLPAIKAVDARFELVDSGGRPLDEPLRARRRAMLLDAFETVRPDAVVIEGFPFARRAFRFELDPLISAARQSGAQVICSVRDIVNLRDDPERHREIVDRVRADFAAVLVHGDPALIRFEASFPAAPEIADRLVYTGYVHEAGAGPDIPAAETGEIIVSGGGGPAGYALLQTAVEARRQGCLADSPWRLLAGINLPEPQFAALAAAAPSGVAVERFRTDFPALLRRARVSVSQAGYNTALDIVAAQVRAVLVPFAAERECEQAIRAERLAALGVAEIVHERELSPATLGAAIERAVSRPALKLEIEMAGAARSAALVAEMVGRRPAFGAGAREDMIFQ